MVNFKIVSKIIGQLLFLESMFMSWCLIMALCYREDDVMAFLMSIILAVGCGLIFMYFGRNASNNLSRRDASLTVTLVWIIFSFFGMMPFLIGGYINNVAGAYLETMSGFTTTGATVIDNVECLPHGILFWRSLTHWIGGLGIVFFTIAVLPSMVGGSVKIFAAEATGPIKSKMHPRLTTSAKWIWIVYIGLTLACVLSYYFTGMGWFDSFCYSMSTTATGGFGTHNTSISYFHSPPLEYAASLFQFLSGVNFVLLYTCVVKGKFKSMFVNSEFRLYVMVVLCCSAWIAYTLVSQMGYDVEHAIRSALFQVVSFLTTTGLYSDDAGKWPHITWLILSFCMFIGACSGSTTGGFKCVRGVMVLKVVRNEFRQIFHPNAVLPVKIDGQPIPQSKISALLAFFALYVLVLLIAATIMIMTGIDKIDAITISLSSMSNVGPALGRQIGPTMSWSILPDSIKWICSLLMLMGRLEVMTVLVIFTRAFWKEN